MSAADALNGLVHVYEWDCPFCAGRFGATPPGSGVYAVTHSRPTCATFDRLDALEFLTAARRETERQIGAGGS